MDLHDIISYCEETQRGVELGDMNALDGFAEMRAVIAAAQDALKVIDPLAITEAEKHHEKTFEHAGLTFTRTDGKRSFGYDHLKEWGEAKKALASIEERAKNAALQAEKQLIIAGGDGEVIEPAIVTYGKPSLTIKRK